MIRRGGPGAWKRDLRDMGAIALPIVFINVGLQAMGVVDTLMVGRLGGAAIASVALGNFYFFNVSVFGLGLLCVLDPVIAQAVGAHDDEGVALGVQRGLVLAAVLAALAVCLMLPSARVLRAFGQPEAVIGETALYIRHRAIGALPFFFFNVFRQALQAIGPVRALLGAVLLANVINALANAAFIYGMFGAPALGVPGSGYATAVAMWSLMPLVLIFSWRTLRPTLLPWRARALRARSIAQMTMLGIPIGTQWFFESFAFGLTTLFMGHLGTNSLAGHEVALSMAALTFMVPLGTAGAASAVVGRAIGRGDMQAARRNAFAAIVCGVGFMCISGAIFVAAPHTLASWYTHDPAVLAVAVMLIPLAGVFQVFDGLQAVTSGILRGTGDTFVPAALHLTAFWAIGVPLGAYLGFNTSLRERGFWWGLVAGLAAAAVLQSWRVSRRMRGDLTRIVMH